MIETIDFGRGLNAQTVIDKPTKTLHEESKKLKAQFIGKKRNRRMRVFPLFSKHLGLF